MSVDKMIEMIFENGVLLLAGGGISYLVKYYFDNVHLRITDIQAVNAAKFSDLENRITSIESKYRDLLDIVLEKFSKWEDRLLGIVNNIGTLSPDQIKTEVEKLKNESKNDLFTIKLKLEKVDFEIEKISSETVREDQIKFINEKIKKEVEIIEKRIRESEVNITKIIKSIMRIVEKQKDHDFKIKNLIAVRPSNKN